MFRTPPLAVIVPPLPEIGPVSVPKPLIKPVLVKPPVDPAVIEPPATVIVPAFVIVAAAGLFTVRLKLPTASDPPLLIVKEARLLVLAVRTGALAALFMMTASPLAGTRAGDPDQ